MSFMRELGKTNIVEKEDIDMAYSLEQGDYINMGYDDESVPGEFITTGHVTDGGREMMNDYWVGSNPFKLLAQHVGFRRY